MFFFSYFRLKQRLEKAEEIIESDRRTKTRYELELRVTLMERIVSVLIVFLLAALFVFWGIPLYNSFFK